MVLSIAAEFTQPAKPHLEFEYPDLKIQEDIYQIMKYSCREFCMPEQCAKAMKIWTTFLEPLIGVPACPPSAQNGAFSKLNACSSEMVLEDFKIQKHHEENEIRSKGVREEGKVSSNRNLEENSFEFFENTDTKTEQTLPKSDPIVGTIGKEEVCVEEAGEETNAIGNDDGEENASGSESANGETFSPEGPGDNGDHDENDKNAGSEGEADCMMDVDDMTISDRVLQTVKPLTLNVPSALKGKEKSSRIFYGNDSFYLLFRLHQMLYERLLTAKLHSSSPDNKWRISKDANSEGSYARFKDALYNLLNGSCDNTKFEDECRALVGAQSYILFTLDKLIHKLVKQLLIISTEELDSSLLHLYAYERSRSPETFCDAVYYKNARLFLLDDSLYRIEFVGSSLCSFSRPMRLTMRLMRTENGELDPAPVSMDPYFSSYLNDELLAVPEGMEKSGVFLKRNKKLYSSEDEYSNTSKAMEGLAIGNGLEMKVSSRTFKISYIMDTEDFMYRPRKMRRALYGERASNGTPDGCLHRAKRCKLFHD